MPPTSSSRTTSRGPSRPWGELWRSPPTSRELGVIAMSLASLLPPVALPVRAAASRSDAAAAPRCTGVVRGSLPCSKKLLAGLQAPAQAPARWRSAARRSVRPAAAADGKEEPTGWDGISEGENYKTQAGKEATLLFQMDTPHNNIGH